jgi:hypothetical protein
MRNIHNNIIISSPWPGPHDHSGFTHAADGDKGQMIHPIHIHYD